MADSDKKKKLVQPDFHIGAPAIDESTAGLIQQLREAIAKADPDYEKMPWIRRYCSDVMLHRFLRARQKDLAKATKMILEAIEWRKKVRPDRITVDEIEFEAQTGKTWHPGKDRYGRPMLVMDSSVENSKSAEGNLKHLFFQVERASKKMTDGVEKFMLFIHFEKFSIFTAPGYKISSETAKTLVDRYPEHMGQTILYQPPAYFSVFFAAVSPFIDAVTKSKLIFIKGDTSKGTENDRKLTEIIGENWRELCGVGIPVIKPKCVPGYDPEKVLAEARQEQKVYFEQEAVLDELMEKGLSHQEALTQLHKDQQPANAEAEAKDDKQEEKEKEANAQAEEQVIASLETLNLNKESAAAEDEHKQADSEASAEGPTLHE